MYFRAADAQPSTETERLGECHLQLQPINNGDILVSMINNGPSTNDPLESLEYAVREMGQATRKFHDVCEWAFSYLRSLIIRAAGSDESRAFA